MVAAGAVLLFGLPQVLDLFGIVQMTMFAAMAMFALSQGFVWGYGGIMSFGQAAFLGIGGYAYAVAALNLGDSTLPVVIAVVTPMLFAAMLGYFMFYGRISDAYIGVITLTVTVILFELVNSTAGDAYHIGVAATGRLQRHAGGAAAELARRSVQPARVRSRLWYAAMGALILVYALLRVILASRFGRVVVAIRENETRAMLLGYDPRLYKLLTFIIGGRRGRAGRLPVHQLGRLHQPHRVQPDACRRRSSSSFWSAVSARCSARSSAPSAIEYLIILAGSQQTLDRQPGLGVVLVAFVLLVPQGVVPVIRDSGCPRVGPHRRERGLRPSRRRRADDRPIAGGDRRHHAVRRRHRRQCGGLRPWARWNCAA